MWEFPQLQESLVQLVPKDHNDCVEKVTSREVMKVESSELDKSTALG